MADARVGEMFVEQAIHGYSQGHRLLATSHEYGHAEADLLGHNSDSAPRTRASDGAFITGYPLNEHAYVVARTWPDIEADRPNTVVTRSLILPRLGLSHLSAERLLTRLTRPLPAEINGELTSLPVNDLIGPPISLPAESARIAAHFYVGREPLSIERAETRDRVALAIWQQLWLSAASRLHFCTAPDTTRFSRVERSLTFAGESRGSDRLGAPSADTLGVISADLQSPGSFRGFIHFVGSGERAVGLMIAFAEAFMLLQAPKPSVAELSALLTRFHGSEPPRLRRLKRRFLGFQGKAARWAVEPFDLLDALAYDDIGRAIYASDASLDKWLRRWWELDPQRTAAALINQPAAPEMPVGPATASEGLTLAFASAASVLVSPETLEVVLALRSDEALKAVWDRNERALWRAWADLGDRVDVPASPSYDGRHYDWSKALSAVRPNPRALDRILRRYPEALDYLIVLANTRPMSSDLELKLTRDARRYIRQRIEDAHDEIAGLARLSDHDDLPRSLDESSWLPVLRASKDEVVHATAYLISINELGRYWRLNALALVTLYTVLARGRADEAWRRLSPHIKGDMNSWDRCGRLIEDFAAHFTALSADDQRLAVESIAKANPTVARALAEHARSRNAEKRKSKKVNVLEPWTWW